MAKTQFSSGVVVTSEFLNGAQVLTFDGQDLDWHYDPLDLNDVQKDGDTGFDSRYVTLTTEQNITGNKNIQGLFQFNSTLPSNAPKSTVTNLKWFGGTNIGNLNRLSDEDLITKLILQESISGIFLSDLFDVSCNTPLDGFVLVYSGTNGQWECGDTLDGGLF